MHTQMFRRSTSGFFHEFQAHTEFFETLIGLKVRLNLGQ